MVSYFLLLLFISLLQINPRHRIRQIYDFRVKLSMFVTFLFAALRGNGNGDYFTYLERSKAITSIQKVFDNNLDMGYGYTFICYIVNKLGLNIQFVIILMNALCSILVYKLITEYSKDYMLSVLIYLSFFLQFDMHATRSALAVYLVAYSYHYLLNKEPARYFLFVFLAVLVHPTAIVGLLLLLSDKKINRSMEIISILFLIIMSFVINFDGLIMAILNGLNLGYFTNKFGTYSLNNVYGYRFAIYDIRLLICIGLLIIGSSIIRKPNSNQHRLLNINYFCIIIMIILSQHSIMVQRIATFFNVFSILLIPEIYKTYSDRISSEEKSQFVVAKNNKVLKMAIIGFYIMLNAAFIYNGYIKTGINYKFFWS